MIRILSGGTKLQQTIVATLALNTGTKLIASCVVNVYLCRHVPNVSTRKNQQMIPNTAAVSPSMSYCFWGNFAGEHENISYINIIQIAHQHSLLAQSYILHRQISFTLFYQRDPYITILHSLNHNTCVFWSFLALISLTNVPGFMIPTCINPTAPLSLRIISLYILLPPSLLLHSSIAVKRTVIFEETPPIRSSGRLYF